MCVAFWTTLHPKYALIVLNNRDEFLARPTLPAALHHFGHESHEKGDEIISGLDVSAGGTWMGINRHGRIAILTNITETAKKRNTSRGNLVSDFLLSSTKETMDEHVNSLTQAALSEDEHLAKRDYAGFNLILMSIAKEDCPTGDGKPRIALVTNSGGGGVLTSRWLEGKEVECHGISNGIDKQTMHLWRKIEEGTTGLRTAVQNSSEDEEDEERLIESLFSVLDAHPNRPPKERDELRGMICVDPVDLDVGGGFSGWYGTRLSTVILVGRDGQVVYRERDVCVMDETTKKPAPGDPANDRTIRVRLHASE